MAETTLEEAFHYATATMGEYHRLYLERIATKVDPKAGAGLDHD